MITWATIMATVPLLLIVALIAEVAILFIKISKEERK